MPAELTNKILPLSINMLTEDKIAILYVLVEKSN